MKQNVFIADQDGVKGKINLLDYTHIRGYHACRPVVKSISEYMENGLSPFTGPELQQGAADLFERTFDETAMAAKAQMSSERPPRVFFQLFKSLLLKHAGQYLCYGSEYLLCIAARLDIAVRGHYHNILLNTGIPTIFVCDVPLEYLSNSFMDDFHENFNADTNDCSFSLKRNLPGKWIVDHEHPSKIFDPMRGCDYFNEQTSCPACK